MHFWKSKHLLTTFDCVRSFCFPGCPQTQKQGSGTSLASSRLFVERARYLNQRMHSSTPHPQIWKRLSLVRRARTSVYKCNFTITILQVQFYKCNFARAIWQVQFDKCNFTSAILQVQFYKCNFTSVNLQGQFYNCNFTITILQAFSLNHRENACSFCTIAMFCHTL
jgi:uncharacterized protein YjbI with pentapeptide repeats